MGCREPLRDFMRHGDQILGLECLGCIKVVAETIEKRRKPSEGAGWSEQVKAQLRRAENPSVYHLV